MGRLNGTAINNLVLRDLDVDQAESFFKHIEENRDAYEDAIPFVSNTHTIEAMREVIAQNIHKQEKGAAEFYTLWDEDCVAGFFVVREKNKDAKWAEIGYMVGKQWRGLGLSKLVCGLLKEELFVHQDMQKIVICCNADNQASIGLAKKLGFQLEGNLRNYYVVNGKIRNMLYFGLLKDEWIRV